MTGLILYAVVFFTMGLVFYTTGAGLSVFTKDYNPGMF
jgi:hypothetical protein